MIEELIGKNLEDCSNSGTKIPTSNIADAKVIGLLFSAHWCPPCSIHITSLGRAFTPTLIEFYKKANSSEKQIEIIFASSDNDSTEYKDYCGIMPWKAIPFGDPRIEQLAYKYEVVGIPKLIIMKTNGEVINPDARGDVMANDPDTINNWLKS